MSKKLRPYMGYSRAAGPEEGACLIFAHNTKEARKLAYKIHQDWFGSGGSDDWIDNATKLLEGRDFLFKEANQEKLAQGITHIVESPKTCVVCEMWGMELNEKGYCEDCDTEIEEPGKSW